MIGGAVSAGLVESRRHQLGWRMAVLPFSSVGAPVGRGIALGIG